MGRRWGVFVLSLLVGAGALPGSAADSPPEGRETGAPHALSARPEALDPLGPSDPYGSDPLGLIALAGRTMEHSLGEDVWEVWICDVPEGSLPHNLAGAVAYLQEHLPPYFAWLSGSAYSARFEAGGIAKTNDTTNRAGRCDEEIHQMSSGTANGAVVLDDTEYINAFGTPGWGGDNYPGNRRAVWASLWQVGRGKALFAHEIGHGLAWPHSSSVDHDTGDNPMDIMGAPTHSMIGTLAINRYAAGWIGPARVAVHGGDEATYTLGPLGSDGLQLLVLPTGTQGVFTTVSVRVKKSNDSALEKEGVEVYRVDQRGVLCSFPVGNTCWGTDRRTIPNPPNSSHNHVYSSGQVIVVEEIQVEVGARSGDRFTVTVRGCGGEYGGLLDIACSTFRDDIVWLGARESPVAVTLRTTPGSAPKTSSPEDRWQRSSSGR